MAKIDVIGQIEFEHRIVRIENWKQQYGDSLTREQGYILQDALAMLWQIANAIDTTKTTALPEVKNEPDPKTN